MAARHERVYLDHLIKRESFLYQPTTAAATDRKEMEAYLTVRDLAPGSSSKARYLRKPDFQRATWAWAPEECAQLLDDVLSHHVVPSVIMWYSDEQKKQYVLDGGHRISVLLAWIHDDWGDKFTLDQLPNAAVRTEAARAGQQVRKLLADRKIASYEEHLEAERRAADAEAEGRDPNVGASPTELLSRRRVAEWAALTTGFPILWVQGDFRTAEQSFLRINKTGRSLSEWETTLVENRRSSFARMVMAVANPQDASRIWPAPPSSGMATSEAELVTVAARRITERSQDLHRFLFEPGYTVPVTTAEQPILGATQSVPEQRAQYLSELFTVTEGRRDRKTQSTKVLLARDREAPPAALVQQALLLLDGATASLDHLHGAANVSLGLVPLVYYYNPHGVYVRNLLLGMVFWLNTGTPEEIAARKLLFTAYRGAFESVVKRYKLEIIRRTSRRIGSGAETTVQTARYYNGLLRLLMEHGSGVDVQSAAFVRTHDVLIESLGDTNAAAAAKAEAVGSAPAQGNASSARAGAGGSSARLFRNAAASSVRITALLKALPTCEICNGHILPGGAVQIDHRVRHADGGRTTPDNGRLTHPFCNNRRDQIEEVQNGPQQVALPRFLETAPPPAQQLSFLDQLNPAPRDALDFGPDPSEDAEPWEAGEDDGADAGAATTGEVDEDDLG